MADGGAPQLSGNGVPGSIRTPRQENHWTALLVSRQSLLDRGIELSRRIPVLDERRPPPDPKPVLCQCRKCGECKRRARRREARRVAAKLRTEATVHAAPLERALYGRHYRELGLDRPSTARTPAPSHRPSLRPESEEKDDGVRYPLLSDYTTKAAIFDLFDWRKLGATDTAEIAWAANWVGRSGGFRRVDPFWSRRRREAERKQERDHLPRDEHGRSLIMPIPLTELLRDYPLEHHDVATFVHMVVSHYCEPTEDAQLSSWIAALPPEQWATAYWVHATCTPKRQGGGGKLSIHSLIDLILQRGWRESCSPYVVEGRAESVVAAAARAEVNWSRTAFCGAPSIRRSPRVSKPVFAFLQKRDPGDWGALHAELSRIKAQQLLALSLQDANCLQCALRK